ncbi:MAG TPA: hypothetical protein VIS09_27385 [Streptomyces sp.]
MASLRTRSALLAAALVAGTALLTACQSDTGDKASSATSASAPAAASSPKAAASAEGASGDDGGADASASSGTKAPEAGGDSSDTDEAGSGSTESPDDGAGQGKGVSGTWFGNVSYLAPGKYTVSGPKGEEQAFFTSDDTEIWGAGDICGDENGQSATKCTEQELEAAARKGVSAEVTISEGIATRITDDH